MPPSSAVRVAAFLAAMEHLAHNRRAWDTGAVAGGLWSLPVDSETIAHARAGKWQVKLTPKLPVPRDWFGDLAGKKLLCLASGGGQQVPVLAAAGADVVSFDLSEQQLAKDAGVCAREGLNARCVQGDMANLACFADCCFDLVFHPASNLFVPDVEIVWRECFRVLRPGGSLLAGFMNPAAYMFDHEEAESTGTLTVKYSLPYSDASHLAPDGLQRKVSKNEPLEFSHSLTALIGGQLKAGFLLTGLYEDHWLDNTWLFSKYAPICIATRALRPK
jgi:SAM-dependent methyltransferase